MFPCVFSLINNKTQIAYTRMLNEIRLACISIQGNFNFNPKKVMTDYEIGAIGAYKEIWKDFLEMFGCFFHFGQCLYRKLCDFGLRVEYIENIELRGWFRCMMALAFVPLDKIEEVYMYLLVVLRSFPCYLTKMRISYKVSMERE